MTIFTAAVLQLRSGTRPAASAEMLTRLVEAAVAAGAEYLQTPEMTGMLQRDRTALMASLRTEEEDILVAEAARLSRQHHIHLHLGSLALATSDGRVVNRGLVFGPDGENLARYDKIHMFDVDLDSGESWRESRTYTPGGSAVVSDLTLRDGGVRLGLAICYDLRFPQLFREEALAGAQVLTAPAAFTRQTGQAHWHVLVRARAIENGAFLIAAAQGGRHEDGRETFGHSMIVDPWGKVLAEVDGDEPGLALARVDTAAVAEARGKVPNLANSRQFVLEKARPGAPGSGDAEAVA